LNNLVIRCPVLGKIEHLNSGLAGIWIPTVDRKNEYIEEKMNKYRKRNKYRKKQINTSVHRFFDDDKYIYFTVITKLQYRNIGQILHVISNRHGVGY
jgi:hypothetical protein